MNSPELNVVTGGLSYIGQYITRRLVNNGHDVLILTGHPSRPNPFGEHVGIAPFRFDNPAILSTSMRGATTLYNTYWVRFDYGEVSFAKAVENTKILIQAAREAGIRKIVHLSVSNPSPDSPFPYYRGKAQAEQVIVNATMPYTIIRPTLVFGGGEEILVNNIAWLLRRFPVFALPGGAAYRLQPIHVEDVAALAVNAATSLHNVIQDAAGPEVFRFEDMVRLIARTIRRRTFFVPTSPATAHFLLKVVGLMVHDIVLTRDEIGALGADLLVSKGTPTGQRRFSDWLEANAAHLGRKYASEMKRHFWP